GNFSGTVLLSGVGDSVWVRLIDNFNRIVYDTITVNYGIPTPGIIYPENNYATGAYTIQITILKDKAEDTVLIYRNNILYQINETKDTIISELIEIKQESETGIIKINLLAKRIIGGIEFNSFMSDTFNIIYNKKIPTSPAKIEIVNKAKYICSINELITENNGIIVKDINDNLLEGIEIKYEIIEKPKEASGETIIANPTNNKGISEFAIQIGNKTGAYIIKASYGNLKPIYIGFFTDERTIAAKEWRLIAINKEPLNGAIASVFYNFVPEYIYRWNPLNEDNLINRKFEEATELKRGEGYFIISPQIVNLKVNNGDYIEEPFVINLEEGWNLLGSPYYYSIDWLSSKIIYPNGKEVSVNQAESEGYIINTVYWYKDNEYYWGPNEIITEPKIPNWNGFWLFAKSKCKLKLSSEFSYAENNIINLAPKRNIENEEWTINISARGEKTGDLINCIGVKSEAEEGEDKYDKAKAPIMPGLMECFIFNKKKLTADIRKGTIIDFKEWNIIVNNGENKEIKIEINGIANIPENYEVYLKDNKTNEVINLREKNNYEYNETKNSQRLFTIFVCKPEFSSKINRDPLSKENIFVSPNPGPDNNGNVKFIYDISIDKIRIKIYDMSGAKVIEKEIDKAQNPTYWIWDCKNEDGKRVQRGVYIYIIEARVGSRSNKIIDKLAIMK
nr:T9SS type A sorting domain-containing protein [bacterium]